MQRLFLFVLLFVVWAAPMPSAQQTPASPPQRPAAFRTTLDIVSVDVVVRDRNNNIVRGLTEKDFEIREDGAPQSIRAFSFQEINDNAAPVGNVALLGEVNARVIESANKPASTAAASSVPLAPLTAEDKPLKSEDIAGRRMIVLLFDTSSMQPEDVQRSVESAQKYVDTEMSPADLVSVATVSSLLNVMQDFSSDKALVMGALNKIAYTEGTATPPPDASTAATDEAAAAATEEAAAETAELDLFNNDMRLRVLKTLAETLAPIDQKKAIVYFSAGMQRSGSDNQVELRAAVNAAVRANVSIYSVDTRGLQAVVPGGDARQASGRGQALFSGRGVAQQFAQLSQSQGTLSTLSVDTGGRAFTDSNDFGAVFTRIKRDMSAYYILGYSSGNKSKDGRFRRINVRVKTEGLRVEARAGYYADRDFAHTNKGDRETQMTEQLYAAVSATDVPVIVTSNFFRVSPEKNLYYVPVSMAVPGSFVPVPEGKDKAILDFMGEVRDERGFPVGRIRQTMELPATATSTLVAKQVLYQSGVLLPPGRFSVKVVVRENTHGAMGTFEAPITIPQFGPVANSANPTGAPPPLKVSSVVLSTQLQAVKPGKSDNPLVRDGIQLLPNLTHVVSRDQKLFFYYEVYDPAAGDGKAAELRTSLAFYRGKIKVMETPVVVRQTIDAADRKAALFQFEVAANSFEPGLYTCQVNIVDEAAGTFAFPRLDLFVR